MLLVSELKKLIHDLPDEMEVRINFRDAEYGINDNDPIQDVVVDSKPGVNGQVVLIYSY